MHRILAFLYLLATASVMPGIAAYDDNCKGSFNTPNLPDCQKAIEKIVDDVIYTDQAQFSVATCFLKYATNKAGPMPLSGQTIRETAEHILSYCGSGKGSFGTGNCESCHVTINFRTVWCAGCKEEED